MPRLMKFNDLPKGARFKYPDGEDVWVVLAHHGRGLIAKWDGLDSPRAHQEICCFTDDDWTLESEVIVVC